MSFKKKNGSKKRVRGAANYCAGGFPECVAQLPTVWVVVAGLKLKALLDSGCSKTIVSQKVLGKVNTRPVSERVVTMSGAVVKCTRAASIEMLVGENTVCLECLIANIMPGFDVLMGMDAVQQLGGVQIS